MATNIRPTYDQLALRAMMSGNPDQLKTLLKHAKGGITCPQCGDEGPHDRQSYMGDEELNCENCGNIWVAPDPADVEPPTRRR